ncbi:solute carrier family 35 member G1-like [Apostichopus japonicus]|uniref:solute carrier family 35 member G1-like n=1 Tax=Stichopus japonicus TaxID=307972 RepID=UPI003AB2186E
MDNPAVELELAPTPIVEDGTNTAEGPSRPIEDDDDIADDKELPGNEDISAQNKGHSSLLKIFIPSRGILVALLSSVLYSCADVSIELSTQRVNPHLLLAIYPNVTMIISLICIIATRVKVLYSKKQYFYLVVSAGVYATGVTLITLSISKIPVGDAVAILNCMPIFGGIFGWILLKQSLRLLDIIFGILCIAGVVLIARPSFIFPESSQNDGIDLIGVLFAIGAACCFGFAITAGRKLQDMGIHILCILFFNSLLTILINATICTVMKLWRAPTPSYYWAVSLTPGVFSCFSQITLFLAIKMERAVVVIIILTSEIVFTFVLQILIIKIIPHWFSAIGSFCILLSCIGLSSRQVDEL